MSEETTTQTHAGVAGRLVELLVQVYREAPPVTLTAWDGSRAEPEGGESALEVHIESRRTVRRLVWSPGQSGIARAYIAGDLSVVGDLETAVRLMRDYVEHASAKHALEAADRREVLRLTVQLGAVGPAPRGPRQPLDAVTGFLDVPAQMREELPEGLAEAIVGRERRDDTRREVVYTDPEPLSAAIARWEAEGLVVDGVRDVVAEERERLGRIGERLVSHWDSVAEVVGAEHARMWRLSLVLVRDNLERRTIRAYEVTGRSAPA